MSHFTRLNTKISDTPSLLKALADLGFPHVESHAVQENLYGYQNDKRAQKAEVIVRKKFIGDLSNDIGFSKDSNGHFVAIISEYDRGVYGQEWLDKLTQRYAYHAVLSKMQQQGFQLESETTSKTQIKLTLSRLV